MTLVLFVAGWIRASSDTVDDAYISFRAVENFLHGDGLSFNPGTRVECFSNPLMVFLLIPVAAVGLPLELASQLMGLAAFAFSVFAAADMVRRGSGAPVFAVIAGCSVGLFFPLLYYSVTGLETGMLAALVIGGVWARVRAGRLDMPGTLFWLAVAYCRPEGLAYTVVAMALALWEERRRAVPLVLLVVLMIASGFVVRRMYYGLWLPNTFYAKPPGTADLEPSTGAVEAALSYLGWYLLGIGLLAAVLAFYWMARSGRGAALPASMVAVGFAFAAYTGGDWFPGGRYLQPVTPLLLASGALGGDALAKRLAGKADPRLLAGALLLSVAAGSLSQFATFILWRDRYPYHVMNCAGNAAAGVWMRDNLPANTKVAAFRIGAVGYYSELQIIDLFGLADHEIARIIAKIPGYHPRPQMANDYPAMREYLAELEPDAVLAVSRLEVPVAPQVDLYGNTYLFVRSFPLGEDEQFLLYHKKP